MAASVVSEPGGEKAQHQSSSGPLEEPILDGLYLERYANRALLTQTWQTIKFPEDLEILSSFFSPLDVIFVFKKEKETFLILRWPVFTV